MAKKNTRNNAIMHDLYMWWTRKTLSRNNAIMHDLYMWWPRKTLTRNNAIMHDLFMWWPRKTTTLDNAIMYDLYMWWQRNKFTPNNAIMHDLHMWWTITITHTNAVIFLFVLIQIITEQLAHTERWIATTAAKREASRKLISLVNLVKSLCHGLNWK